MMKYFFTYEDSIPAGEGFSMFGPAHLLWLALLLAAGIVAYRHFSHLPDVKQKKESRALAAGLVLLEAVRIFILILTGHFGIYELPLHLCGLAGFICFLDSVKEWKWTGQTLFSLCLPGTVSALIFPDWTVYPPVHYITIQGFLFHAGIVLYVFFGLRSGKIRPDVHEIWRTALFLLITVPVIYVFDRAFNANYFFVNVPSPGSPLEWIADVMGVPGYLIGYAVLVFAIVLLMYGIHAAVKKLLHFPPED